MSVQAETLPAETPAVPDGAAAHIPGDRSTRARILIVVLAIIMAGMAFISLHIGAVSLSFAESITALLDFANEGSNTRAHIILWDIRIPRTLLGLLVGSSLAMAGTTMQGLFRNPLADPGLVGVSGGASLAAVSAIVLAPSLLAGIIDPDHPFLLPAAAFFGSFVTTYLLYRIATRQGQTSVATMLLAGIAIGALTAAMVGMLTFISDDQQLRDLTFWNMGSLGGATWPKILAALPFMLLAYLVSPFLARGLNALVLGEADAMYMGIPVQPLKRTIIVVVALSVGASVAVSGAIGFVGIVVPHVLRLVIGPDHRFLLPASGLLGAILLVGADMISRTIVAPTELPIGIITAAMGAPFFLWLLLRQRSIIDL